MKHELEWFPTWILRQVRYAEVLTARAQAQPNIALVKYWGKRDGALNLPARGSLSITLDALWTRTRVTFDPELLADRIALDGRDYPAGQGRASACLDVLRELAGNVMCARVETHNNFPTAAGLASSASGFAALVLAGSAALGLALNERELSILARRASGSAARSIFGGFVEMAAGTRLDGADAFASPLLDPLHWRLCVVVAVTSSRAKAVDSGRGMDISRRTSSYHAAWLAGIDDDLRVARHAIHHRDFEELAVVSEHNCLKMHAAMLASRPALLYWNGATVDCIHAIRGLREHEGVEAFFTIDAGPQVKVVTSPAAVTRVASVLGCVSGVQNVLVSELGSGARLVPDAVVEE